MVDYDWSVSCSQAIGPRHSKMHFDIYDLYVNLEGQSEQG